MRLGILCFLLLASGASASACALAFAVGFHAPEGRIAGIELTLRHGAVASIGDVPVGWHWVIDNDPSWNTTVSGRAVVGAAFLQPSRLPALPDINPEPGYVCSALAERGSLKLKLRVYRGDKLHDIVVFPSSLLLTKERLTR